MITMDGRYTRKGRTGTVLSTTAKGAFSVVWQEDHAFNIYTFTSEGRSQCNHDRAYDLIEVVPNVVTYRAIFPDASLTIGYASPEKVMPCLNYAAILRTTIRNGGKSHTDVTVDVLPVDYKETP